MTWVVQWLRLAPSREPKKVRAFLLHLRMEKDPVSKTFFFIFRIKKVRAFSLHLRMEKDPVSETCFSSFQNSG
jgi:hypothetical protein